MLYALSNQERSSAGRPSLDAHKSCRAQQIRMVRTAVLCAEIVPLVGRIACLAERHSLAAGIELQASLWPPALQTPSRPLLCCLPSFQPAQTDICLSLTTKIRPSPCWHTMSLCRSSCQFIRGATGGVVCRSHHADMCQDIRIRFRDCLRQLSDMQQSHERLGTSSATMLG